MSSLSRVTQQGGPAGRSLLPPTRLYVCCKSQRRVHGVSDAWVPAQELQVAGEEAERSISGRGSMASART